MQKRKERNRNKWKRNEIRKPPLGIVCSFFCSETNWVLVTGAVVDKLSELSAELGIAVGNRVLEGFTGSDKEDHEKNPRIQALKNLAKSGLSAIGNFKKRGK